MLSVIQANTVVLAETINKDTKNSIFSNCAIAFENILNLPNNQHLEIIGYLIRVVRMEVDGGASTIPEFAVSAPFVGDAALTGIGEAVGAVYDSGRYLSARRCALDILVMMAPKSFFVVPELVAEFGNPKEGEIDPEFNQRVQQAAVRIAGEARLFPEYVTDDVLEQISANLLSSSLLSKSASAVFKALGKRGVTFLVRQSASKDTGLYLSTVLDLDPLGVVSGDALLDAYWGAKSEDARAQYATTLAKMTFPPRTGTIPVFIREISLGTSQMLSRLGPSIRRHIESGLFLRTSAAGQQRLVEILVDKDPLRRSLALNILSNCCLGNPPVVQGILGVLTRIEPNFVPEVIATLGSATTGVAQVADTLISLLYSADLAGSDRNVQIEAVRSLGILAHPNPRAMSALEQEIVRRFKSSPRDDDLLIELVRTRARLSKERIRIVGSVLIEPLLSLLPIFLEKNPSFDSYQSISSPAILLAERGASISQRLRDAFDKVPLEVRAQYLQIASDINPPSASGLKLLLLGLKEKDNRLQSLTLRLLSKIGQPVAGILRRMLADEKTDQRARITIARALITVDSRADDVWQILQEGLGAMPCNERIDIINALIPRFAAKGNITSSSGYMPLSTLFREAMSCVTTISPEMRTKVFHNLASFGLQAKKVIPLVRMTTQKADVGTAVDLIAAVIRERASLGISVEDMVPVIEPFLTAEGATALYVSAATAGIDALSLASIFESILRNEELNDDVRLSALVVLSRIDSTRLEIRRALSEFGSEEHIALSLTMMPEHLAVPLYSYFLSTASLSLQLRLLESIIRHPLLTTERALKLIRSAPLRKEEPFLRMATANALGLIIERYQLSASSSASLLLTDLIKDDLSSQVTIGSISARLAEIIFHN
jgi:hypothetical protein